MIEGVTGGRRAHFLAAVAVAAAALLAGGCGERGEPTGAQTDVYPITIDGDNDRPVTIAAPARRIALLDRSLESLIVTLGADERLAGIPVSNTGDLRTSALSALHTDLVVASSSVGEGVLSQAAAVSGAPVYVMPDTSIREVERAIGQLGLITAEPVAARRLVHAIEVRRRAVSGRVGGVLRTTVFVDLGHFAGASDQTLVGDMVREARGRNVVPRGASAGRVGLDELLRTDPDVYIATSASGTTLRDLRRDARTRRLTAVRRGRVVVVDNRLLEPGPAIAKGLEKLARALHPDRVE